MDRSLSLLANGAHVSEYLYYEFRAVDRPLTHREIRELRALSTRAEITATSFVNTYEWGDFKGDPNILMEKYFDAFVYTANSCVFQLVVCVRQRTSRSSNSFPKVRGGIGRIAKDGWTR